MKKTSFLFVVLVIVLTAPAQDGPLRKGDIKLNASIGLKSFIGIAGGVTTFPPLTGSLEYAVDENTTIGPVIGYTATEQRYYYSSLRSTDVYTFSNLLIAAKGNHYFTTGEKWEAYAGAMLGYNAVSFKVQSTSTVLDSYAFTEDGGGIFYGFHAGGRYKFTPNLAAHAEVGYGIALLNVGLTFSLSKK